MYHHVKIPQRGPSRLSPTERELLAAFASPENECMLCVKSHGAVARCLFSEDDQVVNELLDSGNNNAPLEKLKSLLRIAGLTRHGGKKPRSCRPGDSR